MSETIFKRWFTSKEAADYLAVSVSCLEHWRLRKIGPRFYKISGTKNCRYDVHDLDAWVREQTCSAA